MTTRLVSGFSAQQDSRTAGQQGSIRAREFNKIQISNFQGQKV
jgi:hypothetical protein